MNILSSITVFITKRYLFAKSSKTAINIINLVTGIVLLLGSASLIVTLAGFFGLQNYSLNFIDKFDATLRAFPIKGKTFEISQAQFSSIKNIEGIDRYSRVVEERVFLNYNNLNAIAKIKGVDSSYTKVTQIDKLIALGEWDIMKYRVVVDHLISQKLNLGIYDREHFLKLTIPKTGSEIQSALEVPYREMYSVVSGIYNTNQELTNRFVFIDLKLAQKFLNLVPNQFSSIDIQLKPDSDESKIKKELSTLLGNNVVIKNRVEHHDSVYKMLNTEELALYGIFVLVLLIALFNLAGILLMVIMDKHKHLKTLNALGMNLYELRRILFLQGTGITAVALIFGLSLGVVIVKLQQHFEYLMITATIPYPMEIDIKGVGIVALLILSMGMSISWLSSRKISNAYLNKTNIS